MVLLETLELWKMVYMMVLYYKYGWQIIAVLLMAVK